MNYVIDCDLLKEINSYLEQYAKLEPRYVLAVLMLARKGLGRVAISKMLKLRERAVRNILDVPYKSTVSGLRMSIDIFLESIHRLGVENSWLRCKPVLYTRISVEILDMIVSNVVKFRDHIVINTRDPGKIEIIGVFDGRDLRLPGVPGEIQGSYMLLTKQIPVLQRGILICWRNYQDVLDDSAFFISLAEICSDLRPGK